MMFSEPHPRPSVRSRLIPGLSLRAGDLLAGHYRIHALVRADRACANLSASHTKTGEPVDVQVLLAMEDGLDPVRLRFLAEARRVSALRVESVLKVLDVGITKDGYPFLLREVPSGETLAQLLERLESLPTESAVDVALAICEALTAAHAQGIVHGALSSHVVRLAWSPDGPSDVKVLDLGVSRALAMLPLDARALEALAITAPELLQSNREPDVRADVWGVGVLLYTMLAGAAPFASDSPSTVNLEVALGEPAMLAGVPDGLGDLVESCLARDPALRPESIQDLASKLAPFGSRPIFAKRTSLLVVDTGPYEALVLETLVKKAAPSAVAPSEPAVGAPTEKTTEKTPEPVVTSSVAPLAITVAPLFAAPLAAQLVTPPKRSVARTIAIAAAACVAASALIGVGIGVGSARTSVGPSTAIQAAPPPRAESLAPVAPVAPIAPGPAPILPATEAAAAPAVAVSALRTVPAALPRTHPGSPAKPAAPPAAPSVDPIVRSAAAPIHPEPKASDDELRRFLDDRR